MTMIKISEEKNGTFPMMEMEDGQICKTKAGDYILCVAHACQDNIYLILESGDANTYGGGCTIPVYKLEVSDSVTIKFS